MHENSRGNVVAGLALVAWLVFVVWYPMSWTPGRLELGSLEKGQFAVPVKLPAEGPLRLMVRRESVVTLSMAKAPGQASGAERVEVVSAATILPAEHEDLKGVRVIDAICLSADHQSDCYVVLSLTVAQSFTVRAAGRIWMSVSRQ
jgi:hypothetical protein